MALRKSITLPSNLVANYHRIAAVYINDAERLMEIHVQTYKDEETRRETRELDGGVIAPAWSPVATSAVKVTGEDFTALFGPGVPEYPQKADLYAWLSASAQSFLAGAVAV